MRLANFWTAADEIVVRYAICDRFLGTWKRGAKRRSSEGLDGQRGEDAVWWDLMHIVEEWDEKSQRKRERTDDTPGPTRKKTTTCGPSGQLGPSGQQEHLTPDSSIRTPAVDPTPAAHPTPVANPTPKAEPTSGVRPPVNPSSPVCPVPVCHVPVCPLPVCPPPVADTLGGLFGG